MSITNSGNGSVNDTRVSAASTAVTCGYANSNDRIKSSDIQQQNCFQINLKTKQNKQAKKKDRKKVSNILSDKN